MRVVRGVQLVITTSGFGGSGITIGEGAVEYQIERLEKEMGSFLKHGKETEIAIVGSGLIGSLSALHLKTRGYKNIIMITDEMTASATPNAGGFIAASIDSQHPESLRYKEFCIKSFKRFSQCTSGTHPFIEDTDETVRRLPIYRVGGKSPALETYVENDLMSPGFEVRLQIEDTDKSHNMYCYKDGMFVNTAHFQSLLHKQLNRHQIVIKQQHINSFDEISSKIVFNCAGALAGRLTGEENRYAPTLGHYMLLCNQDKDSKGLGYNNSILIAPGSEFKTPTGLVGRNFLNLFPKTNIGGKNGEDYQAFLGGSFIENVKLDDKGYVKKDYECSEQFDHILENARMFFGS